MLSINGNHIWEGSIEKGCGNQVFDYSTSIKIHDPIHIQCESSPNQEVSSQSGNTAMSDTMKALSDEIDRELFPGGTPTPGPGRLKTGYDSTCGGKTDGDDAILKTQGSDDRCKTRILQQEDDVAMDSEVIRSQTRIMQHSRGPMEDDGIGLEPTERCRTRILRESTEGLPIPDVDDSVQIYTARTSMEFSEGKLGWTGLF